MIGISAVEECNKNDAKGLRIFEGLVRQAKAKQLNLSL
jgi:hypothetical protein